MESISLFVILLISSITNWLSMLPLVLNSSGIFVVIPDGIWEVFLLITLNSPDSLTLNLHLSPIHIELSDKNKCLILYSAEPISNDALDFGNKWPLLVISNLSTLFVLNIILLLVLSTSTDVLPSEILLLDTLLLAIKLQVEPS